MTYVVTERCLNCKYTDCVDACPVEAFHEGPTMLYIHPDECIDCGACEPECPVQAIFDADQAPPEFASAAGVNREMAMRYPVILERKDPLPTAPPKSDFVFRGKS